MSDKRVAYVEEQSFIRTENDGEYAQLMDTVGEYAEEDAASGKSSSEKSFTVGADGDMVVDMSNEGEAKKAVPVLLRNYPGYQKHMADQSALSILFKQYGFLHVPLAQVHKYVALKRWRE